jgi:hypothetical protein
MNPLRALLDKITYRTPASDPTTTGLVITAGRWGARTVHHPRITAWAEARRARVLTNGLDKVDQALMDTATRNLLRATAARLAAQRGQRPAMPVAVATAITESTTVRRLAA